MSNMTPLYRPSGVQHATDQTWEPAKKGAGNSIYILPPWARFMASVYPVN